MSVLTIPLSWVTQALNAGIVHGGPFVFVASAKRRWSLPPVSW